MLHGTGMQEDSAIPHGSMSHVPKAWGSSHCEKLPNGAVPVPVFHAGPGR